VVFRGRSRLPVGSCGVSINAFAVDITDGNEAAGFRN